VPLEQSKYILWSTEFNGNKKVLDEELLELIPFSQRANAKPFGLPITPRVWWYDFGKKNFNKEKNLSELRFLNEKLVTYDTLPNIKERKKDKLKQKIERKTINSQEEIAWFWRNIGEKQVLIDESNVQETSSKLNKFLVDIGFRDAKVTFSIIPQANPTKVNVLYTIIENQPYLVDSLEYIGKDSLLLKILNQDYKNAVIKKGSWFDLRLVQKEKARIDNYLKSNGYYGFNGY
jgi:outer membrane protein insertion porin family